MSKEHMLPASKENEIYFHRGSWWTNEPLVQETFGGLETIDGIRTASQYMQYEGLKYAVECNRRRAFQNSGTFPWQFNEPYPNNYCTSNLDYYANPKPVYYGVSNSYRDILVSASFASPSIHDQAVFECRIFTTTSLLEEERKRLGVIKLHCKVVGTDGIIYYSEEIACTLAKNQTNQVSDIILEKDAISTMLFLLRLELMDEEGVLIAENEYLFTKEKNLSSIYQLPEPQLQYLQKDSTLTIHNVGKTAALYLFITNAEALPHLDFLYFNKNYFCLLPQEQRKVIISSDQGMLSGKTIMVENFQYRKDITLI
jgi:beta-mannosidase